MITKALATSFFAKYDVKRDVSALGKELNTYVHTYMAW
jgi:hypothetical protein